MATDNKGYLVVDSPGVNSLVLTSEDEKLRGIFFAGGPLVAVQVAITKILKRSLLITLQIAEMELPIISLFLIWRMRQGTGG